MQHARGRVEPIYPDIQVQLTGLDSNAGSLVGAVVEAMQAEGVPRAEIHIFRQEAYSGNHEELIQTCMRWVEVL